MSSPPRTRERGQGLVEFALVFPVFIICLFGIVDLGRAIYAYNTVSNAARDGVRIGVVNQNPPDTGCAPGNAATGPDTTKVSAYDCAISGAVALAGVTATVEWRNLDDTGDCTPIQVGCLAKVTVSAPFQPITPIIGSLVGTITVSSTSIQPIEFVCPAITSPCRPGQ